MLMRTMRLNRVMSASVMVILGALLDFTLFFIAGNIYKLHTNITLVCIISQYSLRHACISCVR